MIKLKSCSLDDKQQSLFLFLENAPKPPGGVRITEVTSTKVCIQWLPSAYPDCCPVLAYTVHYKDLSNGEYNKNCNTKDFYFFIFGVLMPLSAIFQLISWRPVLVVEEARVPRENHRPWASNW